MVTYSFDKNYVVTIPSKKTGIIRMLKFWMKLSALRIALDDLTRANPELVFTTKQLVGYYTCPTVG